MLASAAALALMGGRFGAAGVSGGVSNSAAEVIVKFDGEVYARAPLGVDALLEVVAPDGAVINAARISGGRVFMEYADCPDGLCLRHGALRSGQDVIVCLPNRVTVQISGGAPVAGADAVAG
jgi:hypothetical protein